MAQKTENEVEVDFKEAEKIIVLGDRLDDVGDVHFNAHFSDEVMGRLNTIMNNPLMYTS